jgi:hypothetical protein
MLHNCEETIPAWRPIPLILAMGCLLMAVPHFFPPTNCGELAGGIFIGLIAIWQIGNFWLGHLWLPKKLLKKM